MTDTTIKLVKEVSPLQAIECYTGQRGRKYLCPFHNDKHPSLTVKGDHWQCWSCGAHGDVISFVQRYFNIGFTEAVHKIAADFGISIPEEAKPSSALDSIFRAIELESRERNRKEIQRYREEITEEINKLTTVYRVLFRHGASEEILQEYSDTIDSLVEYRSTI